MVQENRLLKNKLSNLESGINSKEQELKEVTEQFNTIKLARKIGGNGSDQNSEELKKKIDLYIKEIDKCLKLIGN